MGWLLFLVVGPEGLVGLDPDEFAMGTGFVFALRTYHLPFPVTTAPVSRELPPAPVGGVIGRLLPGPVLGPAYELGRVETGDNPVFQDLEFAQAGLLVSGDLILQGDRAHKEEDLDREMFHPRQEHVIGLVTDRAGIEVAANLDILELATFKGADQPVVQAGVITQV